MPASAGKEVGRLRTCFTCIDNVVKFVYPCTQMIATPSKGPNAKPNSPHSPRVFIEPSKIPALWQVGDYIDVYQVKQIHTGGGMGLVYRVLHRCWNIELAVKSPRPELFQSETQRSAFIRECETWVNLGIHPNVVTCFYVRDLGSIPRIFAEYITGGSLLDWIAARRLYNGSESDNVFRILSVATDVAYGLQHAHDQGLVHQDIKPANILLEESGRAKVSDFGLAKSKQGFFRNTLGPSVSTVVVSTGGLTPAYCSPEQASAGPITRRTDMWSWALCVLEMFAGGIFWQVGVDGQKALQFYLANKKSFSSFPSMPSSVAALLKRCLEQNPNVRPANMALVAEELRKAIAQTGCQYRIPPRASATATSATLNNRGVSLVDIGKEDEALPLWKKAMDLDPGNVEALYNVTVHEWRHGTCTDTTARQKIADISQRRPDDWRGWYYLSLLDEERRDFQSAAKSMLRAGQLHKGMQLVYGRAILATTIQNSSDCGIERIVRLEGGSVRSVGVTPDGAFALCVVRKGNRLEIASCDLEQGSVGVLGSCEASSRHVLLFPDTKRAARWDWSGDIVIQSIPSGDVLRKLSGHRAAVTHLVLASNGVSASGSVDGSLILWNLKTGKSIFALEGHADAVLDLAISKNGAIVASLGRDGVARIWNTASGKCICAVKNSAISRLTVSLDGRYVLTSLSDGRLKVFDLHHAATIATYCNGIGSSTQTTFSSDGSTVYSLGERNKIHAWSVRAPKCLRTIESECGVPTTVAVAQDARRMIVGTDAGSIMNIRLPSAWPTAADARPFAVSQLE